MEQRLKIHHPVVVDHDARFAAASELITLLRGNDQWITNQALAVALGFLGNNRQNKSVAAHWPDMHEVLGPDDTKLVKCVGFRQKMRVFSKRGAVLAIMRSRTDNARACQYWLATTVVTAISLPNCLQHDAASALAQSISALVMDSVSHITTKEMANV